MWTVTKPKADQIDLEFSGKLEAEDMRGILDKLLSESEGMKNGKMLYLIGDFEWPSASAMAVELRYMPRLFGLINRIDKVALLTNVSWVKKAAAVESALIPSLEIKSFNYDDVGGAQTYLDAE